MNFSALKKHGDLLLFALALAVLITALFRANPADKAPAETVEIPPPSLVFSLWRDPSLEKDLGENALEALIAEFESLHEDIKITLRYESYEDLRAELFNPPPAGSSVSSEAVSPGDILALDPLWVADLEKAGAVESANIPLLSFINIFYYNIDILKEAGFSRPPKNRSEFLDYAKALLAGEKGRAVLAVDEHSSRWIYDDIYPWIWAAGTRLVDEGKPALNSRPFVETLSFLADLKREGLIVSGERGALSGGKIEAFCSGRAAFMISSAKDIALVRERMGDAAFGISSVPAPDNYAGKPFYGTSGLTVGVNTASAYPEEAALFADFLAGKASVFSKNAAALSINGVQPSADPFFAKLWDITIAGEPAGEFSGLPRADAERIFGEEISALFGGESSPAESAAAIQTSWETLFARADP